MAGAFGPLSRCWFVAAKAQRRQNATAFALDKRGRATLARWGTPAWARRPFRHDARRPAVIYDYKSGAPPAPDHRTHIQPQRILEASRAEVGGFTDCAAATVPAIAYIGPCTKIKPPNYPKIDS